MFSIKELISRIKNIRNEPEETRRKALWFGVFICMVFVIGIWSVTFIRKMNGNRDIFNVDLKEYQEYSLSVGKYGEFEKKQSDILEGMSYEIEKEEMESEATKFINENNVLDGLSLEDLRLTSVTKEEETWKLEYKQIYKEIAVELSDVKISVIREENKEIKVVVEKNTVYPSINLDADPKITKKEAYEKIMENDKYGDIAARNSELVIYTDTKNFKHYLAWKLSVAEENQVYNTTYFIDAVNGKILEKKRDENA